MTGITVDASDLTRFLLDAEKIAEDINRNERAAVRAAGMAYQHDVQKLAPVDTGQYRASIRTDPGNYNGRPISLIGVPMPQSRRLEYGFVGPDKLGRVYHQKPRPHWRPPFDQNMERYRDIMIRLLAGKPYVEGL